MDIPNSLLLAKSLIYDTCELGISELKIEKESTDYDACSFKLNGKSILYRTAKITPTKIGQFVTIWKRNDNGQTQPFHADDDFDLIIINTKYQNFLGQFIFPKSILMEKGVISSSKRQGKRGIRIYPLWDVTLNKQAQNTQQWQLNYFIEILNPTYDSKNICLLLKSLLQLI
ncbi:MepB family protein [Pedobacter boryungensis]|uniref:MepB family protein n=1 Tax=Pedobacter boryungensis TaxID=869962 RepID=A0ABX2D8N6_9SPHI|nr:MepB family protein [Pedobacter boryungensis]NQX30400.1 MepB family protein [Pedobacter boryungensis]